MDNRLSLLSIENDAPEMQKTFPSTNLPETIHSPTKYVIHISGLLWQDGSFSAFVEGPTGGFEVG